MIAHFVRPSYFEVELKTRVEIAHLRHSGRKPTILFFVVRGFAAKLVCQVPHIKGRCSKG